MRGLNYIKRYNCGTPDKRHYRTCVGLLALWLVCCQDEPGAKP